MRSVAILPLTAQRESAQLLIRLLLLSLLLMISAGVSLSVGSFPTPPLQVLRALAAPQSSDLAFIIWELRLPRIVLAILVGAALAIAGAILQSIVRNPLASPDVIGITSGAALAAVLFLVLLSSHLSVLWLPFAAMLGALISALAVVSLTWKNGFSPSRMVLVGIGLAAAMGAGTTLLIVISDDSAAMTAYVWLTGSLYAAQWKDVQGMLPWLLVTVPICLVFTRHADAMALGDSVAEGLGVAILRSRLVLLACSVALAGAAVAFAGQAGGAQPGTASACIRADWRADCAQRRPAGSGSVFAQRLTCWHFCCRNRRPLLRLFIAQNPLPAALNSGAFNA